MQFSRLLFALIFSLALIQSAQANEASTTHVRFATFNIAMGLATEGELYHRLVSGEDESLKKVAAIIQWVRPDVLLLNEFDHFELDSALLFITNYLNTPQYDNGPITYSHGVTGAVNTGSDSGLDLNNNGMLAEANDAWGFGNFPGQYGMAVLSRFPIKLERSFRFFKWTDMPGAMFPVNPDGSDWYPPKVRDQLRLSSKSHWDVSVQVNDQTVHFLVSHPTPPVFDGPEDRNGARNHDEIRFWSDYINPARSAYIYDDKGVRGGLTEDTKFVIAGDLNADPVDGDSSGGAILQLLTNPLVNSACEPLSEGAAEATTLQAGKNLEQQGNPAADTADFNDEYTGNMRIDYVLPSATLKATGCGVFWPAENQLGREWTNVSDHRLVWIDIEL